MAAEKGHHPNRIYIDDNGDLQLNGAKVWDVNNVDITANVNLASVTATPTELNKLAGVTAGTVTASKALVVDATSNLDALAVTALSLGAAGGTAVTSTAAEINALHSQGAVTTDFAKLHAVTATAAELNVNASVTPGTTSASKTLVAGASSNLDVLTVATLTASTVAVNKLLRLSPKPTDTYSGTMTIDVTFSYHLVAASNTTSATVTYTPSAAGTAGDLLIIETTTDGTGTVTATFASTFHSSGTQATTLSKFSTIMFVSDGTRWVEIARATALT